MVDGGTYQLCRYSHKLDVLVMAIMDHIASFTVRADRFLVSPLHTPGLLTSLL